MEKYDAKSCSPLEKTYYTVVEAALRWCNLIAHEADILKKTQGLDDIPIEMFPQWPCLRLNVEKLYDAIANVELPHGKDGCTVVKGDYAKKTRRTVRHNDLKAWFQKYVPDQKPKFLFDEIERKTHTAINTDTYLALQFDYDGLKTKLEKVNESLKKANDEVAEMKSIIGSMKSISERRKGTFLKIIGLFLELTIPRHYKTQDEIITAMSDGCRNIPGLREDNLKKLFAEANREISAAKQDLKDSITSGD